MTKQKPEKPYPDFPLYPHANGQWAKKIKQRTRFFGSWSDWRAALKLYEDSKDKDPEAFDLRDLCNLFLDHKKKQAQSGEVLLDTWKEYQRACKKAVEILGASLPVEEIRGRHFVALRDELAAQIDNPNTLRNVLVKLRRVFEWAYQAEHVERPLRYRDALKRPAIAKIRLARAKQQKKLYSHKEVYALLAAADPWMKAAILFGINGGLGCRDLCEMRWDNIKGRWLDMPRDKTGVERTVYLWPETIKALPEKKSLWVFCGSRGQQLGQGKSNSTPFPHLFRSIMTAAKIDVDPDGKAVSGGRGFYSLRHTYRTIVDSVKDRSAIRHTMGHADHSIDSVYVEEIDTARLIAVSDAAYKWFKGS